MSARRASASVQGQIFAFVGAKGGVGTTTIAVNVATALAQSLEDERTLLMDFHLSYGDAAVFLGAEPRFSVADAMENTHRLDEAFFESLVVQSKSTGVHLLASAERAVGTVDMRRICDAALSLPRRTIATRSSTCRARKPRCSIRSKASRTS